MKYSSRIGFTRHLRNIHKIISRKGIMSHDAIPDTYDPDNYCKACESSYERKSNYIRHLHNCHGVDFFYQAREKEGFIDNNMRLKKNSIYLHSKYIINKKESTILLQFYSCYNFP
jgi:hypothetical protein